MRCCCYNLLRIMIHYVMFTIQETNDAAENDTNEAIPEEQLDQMRALGMYGLMVGATQE